MTVWWLKSLGTSRRFPLKTSWYYVLSDVDETTNPLYTYLWYIASDGAWYIARITNADSSRRYAKGTTDYVTNFANKDSLTYNVGL